MSVPSVVELAQEVIKDAIATFASVRSDDASLADVLEFYEAEKTDLENSLEVSEEKLADKERRI